MVLVGSYQEPSRFTWEGQTHLVEEVTKRWRVNIGWWHEHIWREYFKLTTTSGLLVVIYHDFKTDQWYLQRLYD